MRVVCKSVLFLLAAWSVGSLASDRSPDEMFDGSFRLSTGAVITGGYFVEGGQRHFLFMDTDNLDAGGLFERIDDDTLRSIIPPAAIEIERLPDGNIEWRVADQPPVPGTRVHRHDSRPVTFESDDGTALHGRLMVPSCRGPHPVVVSVHGSGPASRYGGTYHTFFLKHGIAVLAYDKRGYTEGGDNWSEPDLSTLSADAAAAVRFVATRDEIDPDRIGLVGSSQAGWVIPPAAVAGPYVDFIIVRAGAATRVLDTVMHEIRQELRADGLTGLELDHAMQLRRALYQMAIDGRPMRDTDSAVAPYLNESWYRAAFGDGPVSDLWSGRWWAWANKNLPSDPGPELARFNGAVLWFLAERDEAVPLVATRAALNDAFAASDGSDHEIAVIDNAPHSFLITPPDGPPRFAAGYFDRMATWLADRGVSGEGCNP